MSIDMEKIFEFDAVIENGGEKWPEAACVKFPYDVKESFGTRGQVKVKVTFDGVPYRGSLANMGSGHMLLLRKDIIAKVGKDHGDSVHVTVQKDTEERVVEIPPELQEAFKQNPEAKKFYDGLSYTNRKEYARWVATAKREETRQRRLTKTIEMLLDGIKHP